MRPTALLLLLILAAPAHATQEYILPTLFDVTGVAADDVLNIRQLPDADAPIIGTLSPDAKGIEVVEDTGGWGRVNSGEGSGWVSMRYMAYRTDVWHEGALPDGFSCFGTEPFWSLKSGKTRSCSAVRTWLTTRAIFRRCWIAGSFATRCARSSPRG